MSKLPLTLACGDYEIVRALKEGAVTPEGIDLNVLTGMDSTTRHWRFLRNGEFDVAEVSCSSYFVARDQGMAVDAIPVFLHRRFRHGFIFINTTKGIRKPQDLAGRKIGLKQFQSTALVWLRGILQHEYGVPLESITWYCELDETLNFEGAAHLKTIRLPHDGSVEQMLADGEIDALLHPDLIRPLLEKDPRVARLFPNYREEELAYYQKTGIFPIMHVLGIRREIVEKNPWVTINLFHAFDEAKKIAMTRLTNPRVVPLVWYREAWEEQESIFGDDPWEYGLSGKNTNTLTTLVGYANEQGLTRRKPTLDELFLDVFQGRKRGVHFRV
ncbi:MAG TPA: ABC transporter substrate-binding protein [Xanthobacteraceae bacterium]|nr:ABC transporter substrate-binding protein [Xanthobacteraceae bacterium]